MGNYTKLAPPEYRKIAQNDDQHGNVLVVAYYSAATKSWFIQAQNAKGDGFEVFGPLPQHVFQNLMQISIDIKEMEGRYNPLE